MPQSIQVGDEIFAGWTLTGKKPMSDGAHYELLLERFNPQPQILRIKANRSLIDDQPLAEVHEYLVSYVNNSRLPVSL